MRNLLISIVLCLSCIAYASPKKVKVASSVADISIEGQPTKLHFELINLGAEPYKRWSQIPAEIRITRPNGDLVQTLPVEIGIENPWFQFMDLNDDGYLDLLLYDNCAGFATCAGPTVAADVFLYVPTLQRFVQSKTMSGRGEITKSKTRACVEVSYKSGPTGYANEEWCFNLKTGRWKMVRSGGGEVYGE